MEYRSSDEIFIAPCITFFHEILFVRGFRTLIYDTKSTLFHDGGIKFYFLELKEGFCFRKLRSDKLQVVHAMNSMIDLMKEGVEIRGIDLETAHVKVTLSSGIGSRYLHNYFKRRYF